MRSPGRLTLIAVLVSSAFVLSSLERVLPNPAPMIRFGLGNLPTLAAFVLLGVRDGVLVGLGRIALVSVLWGGLFSPTAVLSLAGGVSSLTVMAVMASLRGRFSLYGISVAGAYSHVAGQLAVVSAVYVRSLDVMRLLPFLGVMAIVTGLLNAWLAGAIVRRVSGWPSSYPETGVTE